MSLKFLKISILTIVIAALIFVSGIRLYYDGYITSGLDMIFGHDTLFVDNVEKKKCDIKIDLPLIDHRMTDQEISRMQYSNQRYEEFCKNKYREKYKKNNKKIYINFIYNPGYIYELNILKIMLMDIIDKNNLDVEYDYDSIETSTIIELGREYGYNIGIERDIIMINTKILKDIMYNNDLFIRIYHLLFNYFRINTYDIKAIPEYDHSIRRDSYLKNPIIIDYLEKIDKSNLKKAACRDDLLNKYNNRICIKPDIKYITNNYQNLTIQNFYINFLTKIAWFNNQLLSEVTQLVVADDNCYEILLVPEIDIKKILLYHHKAVSVSDRNKVFNINNARDIKQIKKMIMVYKHRVLHALGFAHRYNTLSIMSNFENEFQLDNLFNYTENDIEMLRACFVINGNYVFKTNNNLADFLNNYKKFKREF